MSKGLKLVHKAAILVGIPLAIQLSLYSVLYFKLVEADREREQEAHQKEIVIACNMLYQTLFLYNAGLTGNYISKNSEYSGKMLNAEEVMNLQYGKLEKLVAGDPIMSEKVKALRSIIQETIELCRKIKAAGALGDRMTALLMVKDLRGILHKVADAMEKVFSGARLIDNVKIHTHEQQRRSVSVLLAAGVGFDLMFAMMAAFLVINRWSGRLGSLMDNTRRVAEGKPAEKPMGGSDEIAELDQMFYDMANALEAAEQRKQEMVSMVTHDLRSPLTSVRGTLALIDAGVCGELPAKATEKLAAVDRNIERLISLINDLLAIEKMRAGKMDMEIDIADLARIVSRSADSVRGMAEPRGISFQLPENSAQVLADADRIVQVIVNLLSNSIKFSPDNTTITLSISRQDKFHRVSIKDQGQGIAPENLDKIFGRFEQVKGDEKKGTGLGLSICKAIIEQHGGEIGVESELGHGATFWFTLPGEDVDNDDDD